MNNLTISIIGNQILFDIVNELKLFSKYKIKFFNETSLYNEHRLVIFFLTKMNKNYYEKLIKMGIPAIIIAKSISLKTLIN